MVDEEAAVTCVLFSQRAAPAARNAASAPPRVAGAESAARSVINKGGARLRARAPSRALLALRSLTRARPLPPPPTLPKTTILGSGIALLAPERFSRRVISNVNADADS